MLETNRLILRKWRDYDFEPFAQLNACAHVSEFLSKCLTKKESDNLANSIIERFAKQGFGLFAVERKDNHKFIGFTGLNIPGFEADFMPSIEIGWRLSYENWGCGFATEAAKAVLEYGFNDLQLDEIVSFTTVNNVRSRKVMEKIGMEYDPSGDFNHPMLADDHPLIRHVLYRLQKLQFKQRYK